MPEPAARIAVDRLTKSFGKVRAVDQLTFTVEPGTITGFLGPNGAGKTTTLRMLLGLIAPDAGTATIGGLAYRDLPAPSDQVGAVLDTGGFHPARSGRDHLLVYRTVHGYPRDRVDEVLSMVGLAKAAKRAVAGYSLGMRQRLALATALLGEPRVLVLDEPANGLDPEGIAWMRALLRERAEFGSTVLVSSHLLAEVQQLVDQVVIINQGRLVRQAPLAELATDADAAVLVQTPQPDQLAALLQRAGAQRTGQPPVATERTGKATLRVTGLAAREIGQLAFADGVEIDELSAEKNDLEEVFLQLTGNGDEPATGQPDGERV